VMVSHDCPTGVAIPGLSPEMFQAREIESAEKHRETVRGIVDEIQPLWIVHGHYHVAYTQFVDFGYGRVLVAGLDCDGEPVADNLRVFDLDQLPHREARVRGEFPPDFD
jgi:Icc-related predicted phosphoesterase